MNQLFRAIIYIGRSQMSMNANISEDIQRMATVIKNTVAVDRIYLFGSFAYGEPGKNSDYDFYVVLSDETIRPSEAVRQIHHALSDSGKKRPVDVLALHSGLFDDRSKLLTLERKVTGEGVLLYEQGEPDLRMA
jgi:predicted nucleotidyltransferase